MFSRLVKPNKESVETITLHSVFDSQKPFLMLAVLKKNSLDANYNYAADNVKHCNYILY